MKEDTIGKKGREKEKGWRGITWETSQSSPTETKINKHLSFVFFTSTICFPYLDFVLNVSF